MEPNMKSEKVDTLIEKSREIVAYLQENFHPHTTVIIEVDSIRVEETLAARVIEYEQD